MTDEEYKVAIMKNVGVGLRDTNYPVMWFDTYTSEGSAALQVLSWPDAAKLIKTAGVTNIKSLEGFPCWVRVTNNIMEFIGVWENWK